MLVPRLGSLSGSIGLGGTIRVVNERFEVRIISHLLSLKEIVRIAGLHLL